MFGTTFCQMENSLLMTLTALLLLGVGEGTSQTPDYSTNNSTNSPTPLTINVTKPTVPPSPCQKTIQNITQFVLARMKLDPLKTGNMCEGRLYLYSSNQRLALCHSNDMSERLWSELCKDMRCGDFKGFKSTKKTKGLVLTNNMTLISLNQDCTGLQIMCEDTLGSELAAYKAATGILIFLILGVILIQFGRPTYKTIRKRFSQKRQSRWIGPTQSQSVSYHRGQGAPNNNTLKRQSFPGLERLTVNASREPSSNRNSDYDSYGYN